LIRALLWLAVLGAAVYIATRYASPQIRAWRFEDAMSQTARLSEAAGESEMRRALLETADDLNVPLLSSRLTIHRARDGRTLIRASWDEIVRLKAWSIADWQDTLHYSYEVEDDPTP
jgi:hypothetical protein